MTDQAPFETLPSQLFQPERGLYIVPIRHHSPACAWHLRNLLRNVKPSHVLIEAPQDFEPQIPLLLDPHTRPPVALVALVDPGKESPRVAGYYPFCDHSPEYVALREAKGLNAQIGFIDAPSAQMARAADKGEPVAFTQETHFNSSDYVQALAERAGCRDGFELWDHLFETRLSMGTWRDFFGDVGLY
ncbi:MAG: DUF5682 family protein, partial [Pseudomonadota bacterium]